MSNPEQPPAVAPARAADAHPPMRWLTIPNGFSLLRLVVLVPLTIWFIVQPGMELAAAISFGIFGATDWIDGALARGLGQVSRVGEILDPVADRVGIVCIGLALALHDYLPWFVVIIIAVCDIALGVIGLFRMQRVREGKVNWIGKVRTALLMVAMPLHLVSFAPELAAAAEPLRVVSFWMLVAGSALHVVAAGAYAVRYLRGAPAPASA